MIVSIVVALIVAGRLQIGQNTPNIVLTNADGITGTNIETRVFSVLNVLYVERNLSITGVGHLFIVVRIVVI